MPLQGADKKDAGKFLQVSKPVTWKRTDNPLLKTHYTIHSPMQHFFITSVSLSN